MAIEVTIDRLILDGFEMSQRERPFLETAVITELTRLLAENGLNYHANVAYRHVAGSDIATGNDQTPVQFGSQIAQAVYGGLTQ